MGWTFSWSEQAKEEYKILTSKHLVGDKLNDRGGDWWTDI